MKTVEQCEVDLDRASEAMAKAVAKRFPEGCHVRVTWGCGTAYGVVLGKPIGFPSVCEDVRVRFDSGRVHRKHWRDVARADGC